MEFGTNFVGYAINMCGRKKSEIAIKNSIIIR